MIDFRGLKPKQDYLDGIITGGLWGAYYHLAEEIEQALIKEMQERVSEVLNIKPPKPLPKFIFPDNWIIQCRGRKCKIHYIRENIS